MNIIASSLASAGHSEALARLMTFVAMMQVSFSNVTSPTAADAVAVVLEGTNLTTSVPLRYKWATDSPNYLTTGSGNLT